ncbi:MAG: hypothetical protein GY754_46350 [bacterium]|nr:hypothetical protein [bacterium]
MNLKKELRKMKKHRKKYFPVVIRLLELHSGLPPEDLPLEIDNFNEMVIILELLDIGYLDEEVVIAQKQFGNITGLFYAGGNPLTEQGRAYFNEAKKEQKKKNIIIFIFAVLILGLAAVLAIISIDLTL